MARKLYGIFLLLVESIIYYFLFVNLDINLGLLRQSLGLYLIYMLLVGHYSLHDTLVWDEIKKCFKASLIYILTFVVIIPTSLYQNKRRYVIYLAILMFFIAVFISRTIRILFRKYLKKNTLVVGTSYDAIRYAKISNNNRFALTDIIGFADLNQSIQFHHEFENDVEGNKNYLEKFQLFNYDDIDEVCKDNHIKQIVIAENSFTHAELVSVMDKVNTLVDSVKYMPKDNNVMNFNSEVQDFDGILLISTSKDQMTGPDRIAKRLFDIIFGLVGSIMTLILCIVVKIMNVRQGDHDPIIFKQKRIGLHGKPITIYKFRSMVPNAEQVLEDLMAKDPAIREEYLTNKKLEHDPRITKAGNILRKTSLDEFPQFFNVLKGDMSLIGPRPYLFREIDDMGQYYNEIKEIKPGLTGMWQANGRSDVSFKERCRLDVYYSKNWNLWLDIVIVYKTIRGIIHREGAM